jgi:acid phosphatase
MMQRRQLLRTLAIAGIGSVIPRPLQALRLGKGALQFLVVGDWGTGGALQRAVAAGMATVAASKLLDAILSVGDNIYTNGVDSVDDPQWQTKFEHIYAAPALAVPWWAILGNHDYRGSVTAQIDYHRKNPRWNMPATYWRHTFRTDDDVTSVDVLGLDTQQLLTKATGWQQQVAWVEQTLGTSTARWRFVLGHHPMRSYGHYGDTPVLVREIQPILNRHAADMYVSGHDHDLQVIRHPDDSFLSAVSGAGGGVRKTQQGSHSLFAAAHGGFMSLSVDARHLDLHVHRADGAIVHHVRRQPRP